MSKAVKQERAKAKSHIHFTPEVLELPSVMGAVNQTIIINSPNININYISEMNRTNSHMKGNSSKGLEMWNLNNNLKEFNETRHLTFFQTKHPSSKELNENERLKSNSPYLIHKPKHQDTKGINHVYGNFTSRKNDLPPNPNRTISTHQLPINYQHLKPQKNESNNASNFPKRQKQYKKPQFRLKKSKESESSKTINILTQTLFNKRMREDVIQNNVKQKVDRKQNFRKGLYEKEQIQLVSDDNMLKQEYADEDRDEEDLSKEHVSIQPSDYSNQSKKVVCDARKRVYQRALEQISKELLHQSDQYLNMIHSQNDIPSSQIQYVVANFNQPDHLLKESSLEGITMPAKSFSFDFHFDQEKPINKKSSPQRKKKYQETD